MDDRTPTGRYHDWELTIPQFDPMWCTKCDRRHRPDSGIGRRHTTEGLVPRELVFTSQSIDVEETHATV